MEINYAALLPEMILSVVGILIMLCVPATSKERQTRLGYLALAGILLAFGFVLAQESQSDLAFFGMVFQDSFSRFCKILFLFAAAALTLVSMSYLEREHIRAGEFFCLLLFATVGMCLMAASADLILTFLGLEILSVATYVLAGFKQREMKSTESALKYFLLGAFSTAFLLYGMALIYGATGSTHYLEIAKVLRAGGVLGLYPLLLMAGLTLIVVGFGFKVAMTPFHVWTPDVYEGAPIPITAHLAVGSKAAALVAFARVLDQVLPQLAREWQALLWVGAVLTMLLGNLAALPQTNIKRMLAYSSIAHAGYLLVGITAHSSLGTQGMLFYLLAYALMNLGAFTIVQLLARQDDRCLEISDYRGIGHRYPLLGIALSIFLISLAGIPATAGFMGKFFVFAAAVESELYGLVVIALIASAIGLYYYLRVIVLMFMYEPTDEAEAIAVPIPAWIVIVIMVLGTFYLGVAPGAILNLAAEATVF